MTIKSTEDDSNRRVDYDEEGRKLLARVHLLDNDDNDNDEQQLDNATALRVRRLHSYSNPIYKDPQTGGTIHVGNHMAAESLDKLNAMSPAPCRRIVFCLDEFNENKPFQNDPEFVYLTFNIGWWRRTLGNDRDNPTKVVEYFQPLFDFLDTELAAGRSILIHCLAGAHRAGTAGIASLMYLTGMNAEEATQTAQRLRPIINPISDFPKLLKTLEVGLQLRKEQTREH